MSFYLGLGRLKEEAAKIYAAEIISVLETIHSENVMHRDLKPENILLGANYHLKIVRYLYLLKIHLDRLWRCKLHKG
jgi:serine/threonine protein kinase